MLALFTFVISFAVNLVLESGLLSKYDTYARVSTPTQNGNLVHVSNLSPQNLIEYTNISVSQEQRPTENLYADMTESRVYASEVQESYQITYGATSSPKIQIPVNAVSVIDELEKPQEKMSQEFSASEVNNDKTVDVSAHNIYILHATPTAPLLVPDSSLISIPSTIPIGIVEQGSVHSAGNMPTQTLDNATQVTLSTEVVPAATPFLSEAMLDLALQGTLSNRQPTQVANLQVSASQAVTDTTPSTNPLIGYRLSFSSRSLIPRVGQFDGSAVKFQADDAINLQTRVRTEYRNTERQIYIEHAEANSGTQLTQGIYDNNGLIIQDLDGCRYFDSSGQSAQLPPFPNINTNSIDDLSIQYWVDARRACISGNTSSVRIGFRLYEDGTEFRTIMDIFEGGAHIAQNAYIFSVETQSNYSHIRRSYTSYESNTEFVYRYTER